VNNLSYDGNGNIQSLRRRDETGTLVDRLRYDYGNNNQLELVHDSSDVNLGWDAFSSEFGYDDNGNMTSQTGKFSNIAYDHRNLPIHFYLDNNEELIANYNAEGQRILKESSGGAWSFYVTDGMQTLAVITEQGLSHMNLVGGGTFGRIVANSSGAITTSNTRYYHITDHLGSTREVVNNSGSWVETFDYYPFGLLMPKRNTASAETREKFTGHERDDDVGLDYMVWRRYDPAFGRFLSVDPHAANYPSLSPYVYAANNPLIFIDPDGREVKICTGSDDDRECITYQAGMEYEGNEFLANTVSRLNEIFNTTSGQVVLDALIRSDNLYSILDEGSDVFTGKYNPEHRMIPLNSYMVSDKELNFNVAHELFHGYQHELGFISVGSLRSVNAEVGAYLFGEIVMRELGFEPYEFRSRTEENDYPNNMNYLLNQGFSEEPYRRAINAFIGQSTHNRTGRYNNFHSIHPSLLPIPPIRRFLR
jgi:RHS repeat-associated protein